MTEGTRKIFLFMMVSLDGYFEGENHDLSWHNTDEEFNRFAIQQTSEAGTILFGRRTYEMMASYWPSPEAPKDNPQEIVDLMNNTPKVVFSKTLEKADWNNTQLVRKATPEFINKLKQESSRDIAIFGSNNLCVSIMQLGLVDEFRIMVNPVALGKGIPLFAGLPERYRFKLAATREFKNGNMLLTYQPTASS